MGLMSNMNKMIIFTDRQTDRRNNCINLFRLIAALQVAYGHMTAHLDIDMPYLMDIIFGYFQGVPIFFLLSGFLVWDSIDRSKNYPTYLKKRFWRIYPELWMGVVIELIIIATIYGIDNVKQFILFAFTQSTILQFWTPEFLRGYGCGTPNGALWTIGVFIQFYIIIWFIKKHLHDKDLLIWSIALGTSIVLGMIPHVLKVYAPEIILKLYEQTVFNYLYLFLIGSFLAEKRLQLLPFIKKYWYIVSSFAVIIYITGIDVPWTSYAVIKGLLCGYGLIGFAYAFPQLNIKTDVSYGLYIYHMTVVNIMITFGFTGKVIYMVIALVVSIVLAWMSTKTIGQWTVKRKNDQLV